ncbi:unnamed protein product [Prorocentrum cordatum]|uniref:Reverse transcriptase domain-containing protein n=1 Tax=Prorocentrum cordatum TaxID=2364126 RepID=A0ABN9SCD5_9DINO|nr:unnamed protein product [Polarella glacialis]
MGKVEEAIGAAMKAQELFKQCGGARDGSEAANELVKLLGETYKTLQAREEWYTLETLEYRGPDHVEGAVSPVTYAKLIGRQFRVPDSPVEIAFDMPSMEWMGITLGVNMPFLRSPCIPAWLAETPEFGQALEEVIATIPAAWDEWTRLDDCPGHPLHRQAAATRPICLGNSDVKILAAACVMPIAANSANLMGEEQKCVSGRDMIENVVRAEAWGVEKYMTASSDAALLLTDFASAFPSLAQEWLFFVLEAMGIPSSLVHFFRMTYSDNTVSLSATYLGFPIGPEGAAQVMCVSKLLFRLQLYPPSQELASAYRNGVPLLTSGPRNAISYNVTTKLTRIGFATEFLELDARGLLDQGVSTALRRDPKKP